MKQGSSLIGSHIDLFKAMVDLPLSEMASNDRLKSPASLLAAFLAKQTADGHGQLCQEGRMSLLTGCARQNQWQAELEAAQPRDWLMGPT